MTATGIISAIIIGLIIGALGRLLVRGRQHISILVTILVGIVAALIGSWIATMLHVNNTPGIEPRRRRRHGPRLDRQTRQLRADRVRPLVHHQLTAEEPDRPRQRRPLRSIRRLIGRRSTGHRHGRQRQRRHLTPTPHRHQLHDPITPPTTDTPAQRYAL